MGPKLDISLLPFILSKDFNQQQLTHGQWQSLRSMPPHDINQHRVIFSVAFALRCLHENNRTYGNMSVDDVYFFQSSQGSSPVYKLIEKSTADLNLEDHEKDWKSFAEFMIMVLRFADNGRWPEIPINELALLNSKDFCSKIARILLQDTKLQTDFLKAIPEQILHWLKEEADPDCDFVFNLCICCMQGERGTLSETIITADCIDTCLGYYCNDCLNKSKMEQFCPHHGPRAKGLPFRCSKCKKHFGTSQEWLEHFDCEVHFPCKATFNVGTWNVTSLDKESDLVWILLEMEELKVDVMGISETKWKDSGVVFKYELNGEVYYIITSKESRPHTKDPKGVAWILKERWYKTIVHYNNKQSNRVVTIELNADNQLVFSQIYAPPYSSQSSGQDSQASFYAGMQKLTKNSVIAGDFNDTIIYSDYCCIARKKRLSDFCAENEFVVTNMWPSDEEPVVKAQNDFILMKDELWQKRCASSSKKFCSVYLSDHPFPVVASINIDDIGFSQRPEPDKDEKMEASIVLHMDDKQKEQFKTWYDQKKMEMKKKMESLKMSVRDLQSPGGIELRTKDSWLKFPKADDLCYAVSGRLLEINFSSSRNSAEEVTEEDIQRIETLFDGEIERARKEELVRQVKRYKKFISDTIKETRKMFNPTPRSNKTLS